MTADVVEKPKCEKPVVPASVAEEADLSRTSPKKDEVCTATTLPAMTIMDTANPSKPALSDAAVTTAASEARTALNPGFFSSTKPDVLKNIIGPMNASDMKRFENAYDKPGQPPGQFRRELREKLGAEQFRTIEALLDRKDGKANVIGTIATALEAANARNGEIPLENQDRAGRMLRAAVSTLSTAELAQVKKDWDQRYGKDFGTFDQAIAKSDLSDRDKALMSTFFTKGPKDRSTQDIVDATKLIINTYNQESTSRSSTQVLQQLSDVLGGDSPAAIAARRALKADPEFMKNYKNAFENSFSASKTEVRIANDLISEGRISLSTIVTGDTKTMGRFFENAENISTALRSATPKERQDYIDGRKLVADKTDPSKMTPAQRDAVEFYKKLDATFKDRGDARQQAMWNEQIATGEKGLITRLAEQHVKPEWYQFFTSEHHSMNGLSSTIENMSVQEWGKLKKEPQQPGKPPVPDTPAMKALKESISTYVTDPVEQKRLFDLLDRKAGAKTFAEAQGIRRSLAEVVSDNSANTPESRLALANALSTMTPAYAQELKNNPALRDQATALFDKTSLDPKDTAAGILAQSLLKQAGETGKPPVPTALDKFAKDIIDGKLENPGQRLAAAEKLVLENPELRARLSDIEKLRATDPSKISRGDLNLAGLLKQSTTDFGYRELLEGRPVPIGTKFSIGGGAVYGGFKGLYGDIAAIQPESERARFVGSLSPEMQKIVQNVIKQGGKPDLADDAQSYLIGDGGSHREFTQKLAQMTDQQRNEFYANFKTKYGTDFKETFLKGATARDGLDTEQQKLLGVLAKQDFKPTLADELRGFTLYGNGTYKDFEARLAALDFTQRQKLKTEFDQKYGVNLDAAFLPKVEAGDKQKYNNLLTAAETDPLSDYLNRVTNFDNSGITPDGTRDYVDRNLQLNREMLAKYSEDRAKLPPNVRQALDNHYAEAVKQNMDARDRAAKVAEIAIEVAVMTAALATAIPTGGTSMFAALSLKEAAVLVTAASLAGGATRATLISGIRGDGRMTGSDKFEQFKAGMIDGMILASPALFGRGVVAAKPVAAEARTGTEVAQVVSRPVVVQAEVRTGTEVAEVVGGRTVVQAEVTTGREVAVLKPVEPVVKKPVIPEKVADDVSDLFVITDETGKRLAAQVDTPAERLAAQRLAAQRQAAAEREALAQREALARQAALERQAALDRQAVLDRQAAEKLAAEKLAAEQAEAARLAALERPVVAGIPGRLALELGIPALAVERVVERAVTPEVKQVKADPAPTVYKPSDRFAQLATVRRGEGPWQSAERILAADGKKHSIDEVRALTKAIQAAYKLDNNSSDMSGLKVKYNFASKSEQTFNNIINNCKDDKVRALLISLAKS